MSKQIITIICGAALLLSAATLQAAALKVRATAEGAPQDANGNGRGNTVNKYAYVGNYENGTKTNYLQRSVFIFALPSLPAGQRVQKATLKVALQSFQGTPTGNISVYHLPKANGTSVKSSDYQAKPAKLINDKFMTPGSKTSVRGKAGYYTLDVTAQVRADYAHDPAGHQAAAFRFQIDGQKYPHGPAGDNKPSRYVLGENSYTLPPMIEIQTAAGAARMDADADNHGS